MNDGNVTCAIMSSKRARSESMSADLGAFNVLDVDKFDFDVAVMKYDGNTQIGYPTTTTAGLVIVQKVGGFTTVSINTLLLAKDADNRHFRFCQVSATPVPNVPLFQLPEGYRPAQNVTIPLLANRNNDGDATNRVVEVLPSVQWVIDVDGYIYICKSETVTGDANTTGRNFMLDFNDTWSYKAMAVTYLTAA